MASATTPGYYDHLAFNAPLGEDLAARLVMALAAPLADRPSSITDVGCGWAELLLRLLVACPEATGHGIDHDADLVERARANAEARSLADRVSFSSSAGDAVPSDLVINVGAEHVYGTCTEALSALAGVVVPGGQLLFGTQFWERDPTPGVHDYLQPLPGLSELIERTEGAGWRPLDLAVASAQDWDQFEFGFLADWEQVVMADPESEAAERAQRSADEHRRLYLERRGVLGFAYLTLGRPRN